MKAKKFTYRLADPYVPLEYRKQNRHFPSIEKLSYDNYLVSINKIPNNYEF